MAVTTRRNILDTPTSVHPTTTDVTKSTFLEHDPVFAVLPSSPRVSDLRGSLPYVEESRQLVPVTIAGLLPPSPEDTRRSPTKLIGDNEQAQEPPGQQGSCGISYNIILASEKSNPGGRDAR